MDCRGKILALIHTPEYIAPAVWWLLWLTVRRVSHTRCVVDGFGKRRDASDVRGHIPRALVVLGVCNAFWYDVN